MSAKVSVASTPFQGIRIEVDTLVSFDEVLSRLRGLIGDASAQEVVALAKEAIIQAEKAYGDVSGLTLLANPA